MKKKILISVLFFVTILCNATNYYVAQSDGNDSYNGLYDHYISGSNGPWKTMAKAALVATAGYCVNVRTGIYNERVVPDAGDGTAANPIVFQNYTGESPILDGTGISVGEGGGLFQTWRPYVQFKGFTVRNVEGSGVIFTTGADHGLISNCIIHDTQGCAFILTDNSYCVAEYITAYNCALDNYQNQIGIEGGIWSGGMLQSECHYNTIRHCTLHDAWGEGITTGPNAYNSIVEDCVIYDCFTCMIYVLSSQDILIQRNFIYRTWDMLQWGPPYVGTEPPSYNGTMIGIAIWDEGADLKDTRITIINNIVYGCPKNLAFAPGGVSGGHIVANNTFVNAMGDKDDNNISVDIYPAVYASTIFRNNIIVQEDSYSCINCPIGTTITFGNNLYNKASDVDAAGTGDVTGDPLFAKTGNQYNPLYYKLMTGSPAINAGINLNIIVDYGNNLRDNPPNIGAWEEPTTISIVKKNNKVIKISNNKIVKH